jgi:hypothetical protein
MARQDLSPTLTAAITDPVRFPADSPRLTIYIPGGPLVTVRDQPGNVPFNISDIYTGSALDPATLEVTLFDPSYQVSALSSARPFDGVRLVLDLVIGGESLVLFDGHVTSTKVNTTGLTLMAAGAMSKTDERKGVLQIGLSCPYTFGDTDCGVTSIPEWTLTTSSTQTIGRILNFTTQPACVIGDAVYLPGKDVPSGLVTVVGPMGVSLDTTLSPLLPGGTQVTIRARCQKSLTACNRFGNRARCGACPLRPAEIPEEK